MSSIWHDPPQIVIDTDLPQQLGLTPLVAQILARRGYGTLEQARGFLQPADYHPSPPEALPDLVQASEHINQAIRDSHPILVWGDFDVDGQTSTALLVDALRQLGAEVEFYIPDRLKESHGVRSDSLRQQLDRFPAGLLLTCDTGVSAYEAVEYARSRGILTLITDHHDLPPTLPNAHAVVNPKRLPAGHPLSSLPGVGVAFKLVQHLYTQRGLADDLPRFLDLVALGIVADVAEQVNDTRYLLQNGLQQLRQTQRTGIQALAEVAGLQMDRLSAADIGFELGPRLNAAGRLGDARPVVELLTTSDSGRARLLAAQLEGLNGQRRLQTRQIYAAAQDQIAQDPLLLDWEALVLASPSWHPGIIGIVAGQLAERYQRPVVLLSVGEDEIARGSARSTPGYDIGAAIAAQADLLLEHGGHPGAAGLSLHMDNFLFFRRRLSNTLQEIHNTAVRAGISVDAYLSLPGVTPDLAREINHLAPFGEGNPPVVLACCDLHLRSAAYMGRTRQHRRLTVEDASGTRQQVIWWNSADQPLPDGLFDLAFQVEMNTYQGVEQLQLVLVDYRRSASAPAPEIRPAREIIDYRGILTPENVLNEVLAQYPDAAVWAEGCRQSESPGLPLAALDKAGVLVVYTTPPTPQALHEALRKVQCDTVILFGVDPPVQTLYDVQHRTLELVKFVLNRQDGQAKLSALVAATGQSHETVRLALEYYAALGEITVEYAREDAVTLTPGTGTPSETAAEKLVLLQACISETAAYRVFFQRANAKNLLGWTDEA